MSNLFGFPSGLNGGSKETEYATNYNTSHVTNYNTTWNTNHTTSPNTSHSTSGSTNYSTNWNTDYLNYTTINLSDDDSAGHNWASFAFDWSTATLLPRYYINISYRTYMFPSLTGFQSSAGYVDGVYRYITHNYMSWNNTGGSTSWSDGLDLLLQASQGGLPVPVNVANNTYTGYIIIDRDHWGNSSNIYNTGWWGVVQGNHRHPADLSVADFVNVYKNMPMDKSIAEDASIGAWVPMSNWGSGDSIYFKLSMKFPAMATHQTSASTSKTTNFTTTYPTSYTTTYPTTNGTSHTTTYNTNHTTSHITYG